LPARLVETVSRWLVYSGLKEIEEAWGAEVRKPQGIDEKSPEAGASGQIVGVFGAQPYMERPHHLNAQRRFLFRSALPASRPQPRDLTRHRSSIALRLSR
jgi:hypothetical protein